jgi:glucokinase
VALTPSCRPVPCTAMDVSADRRYLAVDLGPTRLAAGIVDDTGTVLVRDRLPTPARHVWPALTALVGRVVAADPSGVAPSACGVAVPGPIDHEAGSIAATRLPSWSGFPLRDELAEVTGLAVHLETTGRAFVCGEVWRGRAVGVRDVLGVVVNDVVDAGVIADGRLVGGVGRHAGAIGHVVVEPNGQRCICGDQGCLDAYAGAAAIEDETSRPLRRTPPATVERAGLMLGRAVASLAAIFDPTVVVIGGAVPAVFGAPFHEALVREVEQRSRLGHLAPMAVARASSTPGASLVGAAAVARMAVLGLDLATGR